MAKDFYVVRVVGKELQPLKGPNGNPLLVSAEEAERLAAHYTKYTKVKHQPRPIHKDKNWREREAKRMEDGTYTPVPWANSRWPYKVKACADHFVHVSQKNPYNIAYTESSAKGEADRQTVISPSKYLSKYYGKAIAERTRRRWLAEYKRIYGSDYELKFAYKAKEIVDVYKRGPNSCMHGSDRVKAYEGPDLAVAYIVRNQNGKERITARSVVWPDKKLYYSIYGDLALMEELLKELGYKQGRLVGARLSAFTKMGRKRNLPSCDSAHRGFKYEGKYAIIQ